MSAPASPAFVAPRPLEPAVGASARTVIAICTLAVFVVSLDATALFVGFPDIRRDFATTTVENLSWVLNAYTIVFGALLVVFGRLADQLGRRRIFLVGLAVFGVTSALCALATSPAILIAARALQGIGAAALIPSSLAIALASVPHAKRNLVAALWAATAALASAVGPTLGALCVDAFGWRAIFVVNVPIVLVALVLTTRTIGESRDAALTTWPRPLPVLALVVGSALLGMALVEGRVWGAGISVALALLGAAILAVFVRIERRSADPSFDLTLFRSRGFSVANLALLVFSVGFAAMFLGFVFFLTGAWHYDIVHAGLAISPGPLTVIPVAILAGKLGSRSGHRPLVIAGGLATAAGAALLFRGIDAAPDFVGIWLPAAITFGIGVGLVFPTLNGAAMGTLPSTRFAVGSAIHQAIRQLGSVFGVALAIVLSTTAHPFEGIFGLVLGAGLATSLVATFLPRPRQPTSN